MDGKMLQIFWLLALSILALANALVTIVKAKKNNPSNYGERIKECETEIKNLKENNEKDHKLIRDNIKKLFTLFNGMKK